MSRRTPVLPDAWPRLMQAAVASVYCGECSVEAFRRSVGKLWPSPRKIPGKGERWLREDLDRAIDRMAGGGTLDAADVL